MRELLLNALLFFPARLETAPSPPSGLGAEEVRFASADGEQLFGWWVPARSEPVLGHVLYCHGNGGNVSDRAPHARLLAEAGFDLLLFDYRGYGHSTGRPDEEGTYRDARAAREALLRRDGVDGRRVLYLGESLGGAVAVALALEAPPAGLILQSSFTSVRDMAALYYRAIPEGVVPDAYPTLRRIPALRAPLLVLHGARDPLVPPAQGKGLFAAAPEPKELRILPGAGHDVLSGGADAWIAAVRGWARGLPATGAQGEDAAVA